MKSFLVIFCCLLFSLAHTQNYIDLVTLSYTNTPQNSFETTNKTTSVEELAFDLNFPIKLNEKTAVLTNLYANKTNVKLDSYSGITDLNVIGLSLGINTTFNKKWSGTFLFFPKLAADNISLSKDNFQFGFLALCTNKRNDNLKFKYGAYINSEKFGVMVVPILGLYYLGPNRKFETNLNLPILADANYRLGKKTWIGLKFDGLGTSYNLDQQNYVNGKAYVYKESNELVSYLRFKLYNSIYFNTKIGYAIARNYEVYNANDKVNWALASIYFGDNRTLLNERFKDGFLFKLELFYRLNL